MPLHKNMNFLIFKDFFRKLCLINSFDLQILNMSYFELKNKIKQEQKDQTYNYKSLETNKSLSILNFFRFTFYIVFRFKFLIKIFLIFLSNLKGFC